VDPGAPRSGRSRPGDDNDNENGEGKKDTPGDENGTGKRTGSNYRKGKWKVTEAGKGKLKGQGMGKGKGKGIVKLSTGGDNIAHAVASQLQNRMYEADSDSEGELEPV